jgi:uncharacterized protein (TIGR03435 family)
MRAALVICVASRGVAAAQDVPRFDVASIKINTSGDAAKAMGPEPGGRFGARNVPLRDLLAIAYGIPPMFAGIRVSGGPAWIDSTRFDVQARAERDLPPDQIAVRVRSLLAERMDVKTHWESRELPVYALTFAKPDRRFGPSLKRSTIDCAALRAAGQAPPAGTCTGRFIPGSITASALTLDTLAANLGRFTGRIVQNRTGFSEAFDYQLRWTPTPEQIPAVPPGVSPPQVDPDGPSLFSAVQEQLGLKLEPQRAPIDVLVIDSAVQPMPD